MPNVIKKRLNIQTQNVSNPADMIIKTASYSGVKNFKKLDEKFVMPRMTCNPEFVKKFVNEQIKIYNWKLATFKTQIFNLENI